jgi:hypothetical protein
VIVKLLLIVSVCESDAVMVKVLAAAAVGVPVIAPVVGFKARPAGKDPVVTVYVYGAVPPLAVTAPEYTAPMTPVGRAPSSDRALMVTENCREAVRRCESVAVITKL